jgi:IPT/TIG domain
MVLGGERRDPRVGGARRVRRVRRRRGAPGPGSDRRRHGGRERGRVRREQSVPLGRAALDRAALDVDSPNNAAFLAANLRNADGTLKGTCNVAGIDAGSGTAGGGTVIEIQGNGFDPHNPPTVQFGGAPATHVTCQSTTQCSAMSPPGAGTVPIAVQMFGVSCSPDALVFHYGPSVESVSPPSGNGGDEVTITGLDIPFTATQLPTFLFGSNPATTYGCSLESDGETVSCLVVAPNGAGRVDVTVAGNPPSPPTPAQGTVTLGTAAPAGGALV